MLSDNQINSKVNNLTNLTNKVTITFRESQKIINFLIFKSFTLLFQIFSLSKHFNLFFLRSLLNVSKLRFWGESQYLRK